MRTHHFKRFCPCHAGETARKGDSASERRTVQFSNGHHAHSRPAGATHLSSCLLFSRLASARTGCWSLLFLSIHTGAEGFHQIDHSRRSCLTRCFNLLARLFLLQEIDQSVFVAILELRWVKVTRLRLYHVGRQIEHFLRQFQVRDVLEVWLLVPNLVGITQRRTYKAPALRLERDHMLAPRQHHPTERDHVQLCNGVPNDGEGFLTHRPIRGYVIGRVDVALIDLIFWNELVDVDGAGALDLNGFYFLILDDHVLALGDLIAAHHVLPRDDLASFRIDILLFQPVARFPVDPIETHFFAERGGRIECNGARDQRKPKIALPVRTRRHWILLNNTQRANYTANFSKCLRPLSGGAGAEGAIFCDRKAKVVGRGMLRCSLCPAYASPAPRVPRCWDSTLVAWYRSLYAPRTGGAYDSHHRTAGIACRTRRRSGGVAARGARAAAAAATDHRFPGRANTC